MDRRLVVPLLLVAGACILSRGVRIEPVVVSSSGEPISVSSAVKVHLLDGAIVVFRRGVLVERDTVFGEGMRYDLLLGDSARVAQLALDSVVGMESFRTEYDGAKTVLYSTLGTAVAVVAGVAIACALDPKCFGSCPTFYADSGGAAVLEAEGFSYSIAQLFEARDVDRLRFPPDAGGVVRLEVRNEAFETHFINHLELLEVRHGATELAVPDERNQPLILAAPAPPDRATDRAGRDIRHTIDRADGVTYHSAPAVLAGAQAADLDDWIDVAVAAPAGGDSVALVLRLRNSLLNTILFYDIMLGDPGARSLDWVARDLQQVGPAVELAQWYQRRMGMDILVRNSANAWQPGAHLKDTGPVAWKDVAIVVPVLEPDSVRLRLRFPADNWRIDRIAVAAQLRRPGSQGVLVHALARVRDGTGRGDTTAQASLIAADARYLEVSAAQHFTIEFAAGGPPARDSLRTFFLASQGYYHEWVRRGWLAAPRATRVFSPSDSALADAIQRWRVTQDTLEARFMATRVPVR